MSESSLDFRNFDSDAVIEATCKTDWLNHKMSDPGKEVFEALKFEALNFILFNESSAEVVGYKKEDMFGDLDADSEEDLLIIFESFHAWLGGVIEGMSKKGSKV